MRNYCAGCKRNCCEVNDNVFINGTDWSKLVSYAGLNDWLITDSCIKAGGELVAVFDNASLQGHLASPCYFFNGESCSIHKVLIDDAPLRPFVCRAYPVITGNFTNGKNIPGVTVINDDWVLLSIDALSKYGGCPKGPLFYDDSLIDSLIDEII